MRPASATLQVLAPLDERPPRIVAFLLGLTLLTSSVVMFEPAPCDVLFLPTALVVLLTARSLSTLPLGIGTLGGGMLFFLANLASLQFVEDPANAVRFLAITVYMLALAYCAAALVSRYGETILRTMFLSYSGAAILCASIGLLAHYRVLPYSEIFFRDEFGLRIQSTFKDPNVFGPFLVPAVLWTLAVLLERPRMTLGLFSCLALYLLAILYTFSRGAWLNLGVSVGAFVALELLVVRNARVIRRLTLFGVLGALATPLVIGYLLTMSSMGDYFSNRLSFQSYDSERFGTHQHALRVSVQSPLGVGPGEWNSDRFIRATHNLYLRVLAENGWLGAFGWLVFLGSIMLRGLRVVLGRGPFASLQAAVLASIVGILAESMVIDTLHWRHFFLLLGMAMGLALYERQREPAPAVSSLAELRPRQRMSG